MVNIHMDHAHTLSKTHAYIHTPEIYFMSLSVKKEKKGLNVNDDMANGVKRRWRSSPFLTFLNVHFVLCSLLEGT